jgi:hypothetical protein
VPRKLTMLSRVFTPLALGGSDEHADELEQGMARTLDRLKAAAERYGFKFDRHAARNELQAATFGKRRPAIARLLLSPTGAMAIEVRGGA